MEIISKSFIRLTLLVVSISIQSYVIEAQYANPGNIASVESKALGHMLSLLKEDPVQHANALSYFEQNWKATYIPMLLDVLYFSERYTNHKKIIHLLESKTDQNFGRNISDWYHWLWNKDPQISIEQGEWMANLYKNIDPKFETYFKNRAEESTIRLDEVRWGGVLQDGIPPLRRPLMINGEEAEYLKDENIIFGISINGDHRAYPKRILAWHEMFVDEIGGEFIAGVYCTLCGTVIAYNTKYNGKHHDLGTSGFLYRSNKLMYDKATQSLWNTIEGKPVIGPLINDGIELKSHSVVTTTWGEWKRLHPTTQVLSLNTGHRRNYNEGNAYKNYFATDDLMFNVPKLDQRLLNKDEVLIIRADGYQQDPLAISTKFLQRKKVYQNQIGPVSFVVITDATGANRVYESKHHIFKKKEAGKVKDKEGNLWAIHEEYLSMPNGKQLKRLPYHRMFWFAWFNTYPDTRLVK